MNVTTRWMSLPDECHCPMNVTARWMLLPDECYCPMNVTARWMSLPDECYYPMNVTTYYETVSNMPSVYLDQAESSTKAAADEIRHKWWIYRQLYCRCCVGWWDYAKQWIFRTWWRGYRHQIIFMEMFSFWSCKENLESLRNRWETEGTSRSLWSLIIVPSTALGVLDQWRLLVLSVVSRRQSKPGNYDMRIILEMSTQECFKMSLKRTLQRVYCKERRMCGPYPETGWGDGKKNMENNYYRKELRGRLGEKDIKLQ